MDPSSETNATLPGQVSKIPNITKEVPITPIFPGKRGTPISDSSETPKNKRKSQIQFISPIAPLKAQADIIALGQQRHTLKTERESQRRNLVSTEELRKIRAEIRNMVSYQQSNKVTNLIRQLIDVVRETRFLSEKRQNLEEMVNEEIARREEYTKEYELVRKTLDLSDIVIDPIKFSDIDLKEDERALLAIEQSKQELNQLKTEINRLNKDKPDIKFYTNAINSYYESSKMQWKIFKLGVDETKQEIKTLIKENEITEQGVRNLETEISSYRNSIYQIDDQNSKSIETFLSQVNNNSLYFQEQLSLLDFEIDKIARKISSYDSINNETQDEIDILTRQVQQIKATVSQNSNYSISINSSFI